MFIYSFFANITFEILKFIGLFSPKIKKFVAGRLQTNLFLKTYESTDEFVVFHCASLGEFEQGLPLMQAWTKEFNHHKIIVTFFSPSGYEIRKNHSIATHVLYLPWDNTEAVNLFIKKINPKYFFLIKYEFWPNLINQLHQNKIPVFVVSAIFRSNQIFFKSYGFWMKHILNKITHFFVQNQQSKSLLNHLGVYQVSVTGDTRFDRVSYLLSQTRELDFIATFKAYKTLVVIGSSWPKDEELWLNYINQSSTDIKFIIAPHNIKAEAVNQLKKECNSSVVLYSESLSENFLGIQNHQVLVVDTIGLLTKIYAYANIAYVGGGFGMPGIHNILEPAVFGIPIIIGPNFSKFQEAVDLHFKGGMLSISNYETLHKAMTTFLDENKQKERGDICANFVKNNLGATNKIIEHLKTNYI